MKKMAYLISFVLFVASLYIPTGANANILKPHDPIYIKGNQNFTCENGVIGGNGTKDNPYIIEGWYIEANATDGIRIESTTAYFVIRNCIICGNKEHAGISFFNVINGKIEKCRISCTDQGIYIFPDISSPSANIVITSSEIFDSNDGIYLSGANVSIKNCTIHHNHYGIFSPRASDAKIENCTVSHNEWGFSFGSFSYGTILNNLIHNNTNGIFLYDSWFNRFRFNTLENNRYNFGVEGSTNLAFYQDIDISNTIEKMPIYYLVGRSNLAFDGIDAGYLGLVSCKNVIIRNLTLTKNFQGLLLIDTHYAKILNNRVHGNYCGIFSKYSSNSFIENNTIYNNFHGIDFSSSKILAISSNQIYNNSKGMHLYTVLNSKILNNLICNNSKEGILLAGSSLNELKKNCICGNELGLMVWYSNFNRLIGNIFYGNDKSATFGNSVMNVWLCNFWEKPLNLPKVIYGYQMMREIKIPWINIDPFPATSMWDKHAPSDR